jgi:hypothetical protein
MTRIVSFSLYNDRRKDVLNAVINCVLAPSIYPGWTCRFYLDDTVPKQIVVALESFDHVELRWMPRHTGSAAKLWRFLAAGEVDLEAVIVRDADSWLSTREAVCVEAWLSSGRDFHVIRDHCYHAQPMMGGMWGVRGGVLANIGEWISEYEGTGGAYDQGFLADWVYPLTVGRALVHRGDQHDGAGAPTDYFHDGAVPIPDCDEVDEAVAGISWREAHRLNAFTCSHCRQVHPTYIGPIFEAIPVAALEVVERLGIASGDGAGLAMTVAPACVPGIEINEVKDGLVVYDPSRDRVHYLNHTAALILALCTGRNAQADIIRLVKDAFSLDVLPASEVTDCLAQLRNQGLIS